MKADLSTGPVMSSVILYVNAKDLKNVSVLMSVHNCDSLIITLLVVR
jgi:hypothetical protein